MSEQILPATRKHWYILEGDEDLKSKTAGPPNISLRRSKNLKDKLVRKNVPIGYEERVL